MSKFIIACPVCHNYAEASTGFFASKHIRCACGNVINVKTDRMTPGSARAVATMWCTTRRTAPPRSARSARLSW